MNNDYKEKLAAVKECLSDYSEPIFVSGIDFDMTAKALTIIDATMPIEELLIIGNKYPNLIKNIKTRFDKANVLLIKNFDKISLDKQKLFADIICNNSICSEKLPDNLRIIINSIGKCNLIPEIKEVVQYFEI